ncbi:MAG: hypothetical protein FWF36_09020, partial [Propionibacteriaceae bacterium]|nr:hypothetical protein [Propionibacteriaceae bacterium]
LNKAVTFFGVEPFDGSGCHSYLLRSAGQNQPCGLPTKKVTHGDNSATPGGILQTKPDTWTVFVGAAWLHCGYE